MEECRGHGNVQDVCGYKNRKSRFYPDLQNQICIFLLKFKTNSCHRIVFNKSWACIHAKVVVWLPSWTIVVSDTKVAVAENMGPALPNPAVPEGSQYKRNRCPSTYLCNSCDKTFFQGAEAARVNSGESRPPPALCTPESQEPGNVVMCLATGSWQTRSEGFWDGKIVLDHWRGHRVITRVFQSGNFSRLGSERVTLEKNGWKDVNLLALKMGEGVTIPRMSATARGWKNKEMGLSTFPPEKKTDWAWIPGPGEPSQIMYFGLWFLKH